MQPYFYPYIGYFQLINYVDKFVVYDDVNFIKGGWINRNRILINGRPHFINAQLISASSNKLINEINLSPQPKWKKKLLKSIRQNYIKAPHFEEVFPVIQNGISRNSDSLSCYLRDCIFDILNLLEISTQITVSSSLYNNSDLSASERVMDICRKENAHSYVNAIGGRHLYNKKIFSTNGIELFFLRSKPIRYAHFTENFVPNLSIIDVLMHLGTKKTKAILTDFEII